MKKSDKKDAAPESAVKQKQTGQRVVAAALLPMMLASSAALFATNCKDDTDPTPPPPVTEPTQEVAKGTEYDVTGYPTVKVQDDRTDGNRAKTLVELGIVNKIAAALGAAEQEFVGWDSSDIFEGALGDLTIIVDNPETPYTDDVKVRGMAIHLDIDFLLSSQGDGIRDALILGINYVYDGVDYSMLNFKSDIRMADGSKDVVRQAYAPVDGKRKKCLTPNLRSVV
jgi:hypothetical protein